MRYRVITIGREFGSGGAEIARHVAAALGWRVVDQELLAEISRRAGVSEADAKALDERVDPWLHRLMRAIWDKGPDGVQAASPVDLFDADAEAMVAKAVIEEAHRAGKCVIVGRGAQCVLRGKPDVLHVFVYAPVAARARRVRSVIPPGHNPGTYIASIDEQRRDYVRRHYDRDRLDPRLYDLMVNSHGECAPAAELILFAAGAQRVGRAAQQEV